MSDSPLPPGATVSPGVSPEEPARPVRSLLERRMQRCGNITRNILLVFGIGAIIAQIAKIFPTFVDPGWDANLSNLAALVVGGLLFWLGKSSVIDRGIRAALGKHRNLAQRILFSLPFFLSLVVIALKLALGATKPYKLLMGEGSFVEYGTVLAYFVAAGFAIPVANGFRKQSESLLSMLYGLFAAFCLFVGLEEISWGQMVIGWQSNEFFKETNVQRETNLHNMPWFQDLLGEAFILVSFACVVVTVVGMVRHRQLKHQLKRQLDRQSNSPANPQGYPQANLQGTLGSAETTQETAQETAQAGGGDPRSRPILSQFFFPGWYTLSYCAMTLVIYVIIEYLRPWFSFIITTDQEFAELLLSMGFMLVAVTGYFRQGLLYGRCS